MSISSKWLAGRDDTFSGFSPTFNYVGFDSGKVLGMTNSTQLDRKSARAHRGQGGFGMLEAIIGMVMVALLIGAGATGLRTLQSASREANPTARMDAVVVGASEALRETPYQECANEATYQDAILVADDARLDDQNLSRQTASGKPTIEVTSVESETCGTPAGDNGRQKVNLKVTNNGKSRTAKVTKFDETRRLRLPIASIDPSVPQTKDGDIRMVFSFTAKQSTSFYPLYKFEWNCDATAPPAGVSVPGTAVTDETELPGDQMFCEYTAGPNDKEVTVKLRVTDDKEQSSEDSVTITVPKRTEPRLSPVAAAAVASGGGSTGSPGASFSFSSAGTLSPYGTPLNYSWDFGDPQSGSSNGSISQNPSHTFYWAGNYVVTMTVTDELGLTSSANVPITIDPIDIPLPLASFPEPSPAPGEFHPYTPISFDGTSSRAHPDVAVSSYYWDFGDGTTATGGIVTHAYSTANPYVVELTVKDASGQTSSVTQVVMVKPLSPPSNFRATGSRAKIPWIRTGYIDFAWTPVQSAPGENLVLEIEIQPAPSSLCWDGFTRNDSDGIIQSSGRYRWEEPNLNLLNLGKTFCAGSTYPYRARLFNKNAPRMTGVNPGPDSPIQYRGV